MFTRSRTTCLSVCTVGLKCFAWIVQEVNVGFGKAGKQAGMTFTSALWHGLSGSAGLDSHAVMLVPLGLNDATLLNRAGACVHVPGPTSCDKCLTRLLPRNDEQKGHAPCKMLAIADSYFRVSPPTRKFRDLSQSSAIMSGSVVGCLVGKRGSPLVFCMSWYDALVYVS